MFCIFKPSFACTQTAFLQTTLYCNVNKATFETCFAAGIYPEDGPESIRLANIYVVLDPRIYTSHGILLQTSNTPHSFQHHQYRQ